MTNFVDWLSLMVVFCIFPPFSARLLWESYVYTMCPLIRLFLGMSNIFMAFSYQRKKKTGWE